VTQVQHRRCGCDDCTQGRPCIPVFAPKPVVYSPVMCRCCDGKTREVSPNEEFITMDYRRGIGVPFTRITSFRFLCDDCEVITWRKNS